MEKNNATSFQKEITIPGWCGFPSWHDTRYTRLVAFKRKKKIKVISVQEYKSYTFGRSAECNIKLKHPSISRKHAILAHHRDSGGFRIIDLGTKWGTCIRDKRIAGNTWVKIPENCKFSFGVSRRDYYIKGTLPGTAANRKGIKNKKKK